MDFVLDVTADPVGLGPALACRVPTPSLVRTAVARCVPRARVETILANSTGVSVGDVYNETQGS